MKTRWTMQDIAEKLGITKMTVSRYLKDPKSVSKETGLKIAKLIDELGYIAPKAPAMLSKSSSKAIGVIVPSFSNMVFSDVILGVNNKASKEGYSILITHMSYDMLEEEKQVADLISYQVDALILSEPKHTPLTLKRLKEYSLPVVETMSLPYRPIDLAVGLDHEEIAYKCTKALLECGRRKIAYLAVRLDFRTLDRQKGYEKAMLEKGLEPLTFSSPERSSFTMAGDLMREALASHKDLDAIICTNDDVAVGAMLACQALGIKIPDDLAILGYNGLDIANATIPKLCSIKTPRLEIGETAFDLILKRLNHEKILKKKIKLSHGITDGATVTKEEHQALLKTCED